MKELYKRIISGALVLVTLFSICVPASASDSGSLNSPLFGDFWTWVQYTENRIWSIFDEDKCPKSPNTNGLHEFVKASTSVDGKPGVYLVCKFCGKSAGEVGNDAYQQQVEELPATGYTSDGSLLWSPKLNCFYVYHTYSGGPVYYAGCPHCPDFKNKFDDAVITTNCDTKTISVRPKSGSSSFTLVYAIYEYKDVHPIDGFYTQIESPSFEGYYVTSSGRVPFYQSYSAWSSGIYYDSLSEYSDSYFSNSRMLSGKSLMFFSAQGFAPVYKIVPFDSIVGNINNTYNITTRPTSITGGNYGIVGDNNQIITINNTTNDNKIINETNNTYYNPATGKTAPITNWSYNYDGRIYNITLDTGDTVSVEYGDENITIIENNVTEGNTIVNNYVIYYMIDDTSGEDPTPTPTPGPTPTPSPTACPHIWKELNRTEPTCTSPGSASFSCEKCGETKTDKLPAIGHTWQVLRTVNTTYDEEGNLLQQGYTIYQCSVCSEQYKDDQGTGPPGGGGKDDDKDTIWDKLAGLIATIVDGIIGILDAVLGKLLDALVALAKMLADKLLAVVEVVLSIFDELPQLFGGFLDFLALVFPFLPSEIVTLLTFGVVAVVFAAIIKAIRR